MTILAVVVTIAMILSPQNADAGAKPNTDAAAAAKAKQEALRKQMEERYMAEAKKHARENGKIITPYKPYLSLPIPDPITKKQLEHLGYVMQLSDAQMRQLDALHEKYLDDGWAYRRREVQPLWERSMELCSAENKYTAAWSEQVQAMRAEALTKLPALQAIDDKLIEAMRPFLSDEQIPLMARATLLRERQFTHAEIPLYLGSRYDLTETLFEFFKKDYDLTPVDREQYEHVLSEYEREATALFGLLYDYCQKTSEEGSAVNAQLRQLSMLIQEGKATPEEVMAQAQPLNDRRHEIERGRFDIERRIHRLNERFLKLFAEQLPDATGKDLLKWWREKIYRHVYPDPYDLEDLLQASARIESLNDDQRISIEAAAIDYRRREDALSQSMLNEFNTWNDEVTEKSGYNPLDYEEYAKRMRALQSQRHENADKTVAAIQSALDENQWKAMGTQIEKYNKSVQAFEDKLANRPRYAPSWPGPWSDIVD